MTDRSFGDHTNRNIVKNPLLSTAVTGLSLEDLTHNAVLLPVSQSQELITRLDDETHSQTLRNTGHITPSFPSGDTNSNITILHQHPSPQPTMIASTQQNKKIEKQNENLSSTESKASMKTEDDFDVNEYFARLHGTRYVSAPLHSSLKEDKNSNLEEAEENLEEINLNEPQAEAQQSLTSDIAQNFSQLPTVLPQVASAVFSSFSNMLSMKSREQTPDSNAPSSSDHHVQFESQDVPLMVAESPREAPPPPLKQPPPVGTGNYRLASTKKKYAQIPGLSSGEIAQSPAYNPMNQSVPSYFTPADQYPTNIPEARANVPGLPVMKDMSANKKQESYNIFTPIESDQCSQTNRSALALNKQNINQSSQFPSDLQLPPSQPNAPIIPPPPMFSNMQRKDGQTNARKTILPPSVARRISANQPIIKHQEISNPAFSEHIFVPPPAFDNTDTSSSNLSFNTSSAMDYVSSNQSVFTPTDNSSASMSGLPNQQLTKTSSSIGMEPFISESHVHGQPPTNILPGVEMTSKSLSAPSAVPLISASSIPSLVSVFTPVDTSSSQSNIPPAIFNLTLKANETAPVVPPPSFFNPAKLDTFAISPPTYLNPVEIAQEDTAPSSSFVPLPLSKPAPKFQSSSMPPSYFTQSIPNESVIELKHDTNVLQNSSQYFDAGTSSEPPLPEPPKATGNLNFRMAKKRPQYYSGPIEGVGSISNNVKPIIQPVENNTFQGGIFVPQTQEITEQISTSSTETSVPFDISRQSQNPQFNQPEQIYMQTQYKTDMQPQFNTEFDLSRLSTDNYEPMKEEKKGFGFIGSLKSKLSSLDINKIQSSVTTFFDPAYNASKVDGSVTQQSISAEKQQQQSAGQYPQGQSSFEIFVPSIEPSHQYSQIYDYQMSFHNQQNQQQNRQYYKAPGAQNTQSQSVFNPPNQPTYNMSTLQENIPQSYSTSATTNVYESLAPAAAPQFSNNDQNLPLVTKRSEKNEQSFQNVSANPFEFKESLHNVSKSTSVVPLQENESSQTKVPAISDDTTQTGLENVSAFKDKDHFPGISGTPSFFGSYENQTNNIQEIVFESLQTLQKRVDDDLNVKKEIQKIAQNILATESREHFFDHKASNAQIFPHQSYKDNNDQSMYSLEKSDIKVSGNPGLEDENAIKQQKGTYLENEMRKMSVSEVQSNVNAEAPLYTTAIVPSNKDFNEDKENTPKDVSELSICETCREFDKPEDREVEDLTTQLIENITSPIQLSNPVEVPLTESNITIDDTGNFNTNQCAEISHITEETIESIHVQSVAELLKDDDVASAGNYGWSTEHSVYPTESLIAQECDVLKPITYNVLNPNAIGFFGSDSLFADNMPKKASDEIKAEFKSTHEEPIILTQTSIPSAPPAENIKLDEIGIDVHSIEQDAKKDFPIFEEFVIEPSKTDDDKIECKERRRSSGEIKNIDSFTYRVERFKQMEEKETDLKTSLNLSSTSPSLPIASYFDTGNYAAETHYRNSLTSPPNLSSLNIISPNQVTVPPGFEDIYKRNISGMNSQTDCNTETRLTYSPTFQSTKIISVTTASLITSQVSDQETRPAILESLPNFQNTFCYNLELNQQPFFSKPSTDSEDASEQSEHFTRVPNNSFDKRPDADNNSRQIPNCGTQTHPTFSPTFNTAKTEEPFFSKSSANCEDALEQSEHFTRVQNNSFDRRPDADSRQIPDCGTQSHPIFSPTFSTAKTEVSDVSTSIHQPKIGGEREVNFPNTSSSKQESKDVKVDTPSMHSDAAQVDIPRTHSRTPRKPIESNKMPILANIFGVKDEHQGIHPISKHHDLDSSKTHLPSRLPAFSNIFDTQKELEEKIEAPSIFQTSDDDVLNVEKPLPDPWNFFSSGGESASQSSNEAGGTSRLASYFSSPPKTDSTKSFFELSQGQDHYRQENKILASGDSKTAAQKSFIELSQSQSYDGDSKTYLQNIPPEKYLANLNLMKDLTSVQNFDVSSDQVVESVNYFTVHYNFENLPNEFNKGEPESSKNETKINAKIKNDELNHDFSSMDLKIYDDKTVYKIVVNCKKCCNMNVGYVKKYDYLNHEAVIGEDFKVKKSMDNNTGGNKDSDEHNMPQRNVSNEKGSVTVNFGPDAVRNDYEERDSTIDEKQITTEYVQVKHHWFYRIDVDGKSIWRGFSVVDSRALEDAYLSPDLNDRTLVPTDGGRYDVNVIGRLRVPVYWSEKPSNVMRCSWFYKGTTDARYVPYTEAVAEKLEEEYRHGVSTGVWHRRLALPNNEVVIMHGPAVMVHFLQSSAADAFGSAVSQPTQISQLLLFGKRVYRNPPKIRVCHDQPSLIDHLLFLVHGAGEYSHQKERIQSTMRPRVVRRGHEETEIEDIEPSNIDHLLLLCHGVGSACDIRFRNVEEVVDDFRTTSLQLVQSHYKNSYDAGIVGRVEVLPISWHATLHSGQTGVDRRLSRITLDSIPRLRSFTNDTVLDVLFYTSPVFCQTIIDTVCKELNRIYGLFLARNPDYKGGVSLGGHSLGSVILYDLLCHQRPQVAVPCSPDKTYVAGAAGTGQPVVNYPHLEFQPVALYALGSPIAIFECIRGVDCLGGDFCLPTCKNFFNIFHPYDPIAYRIEPLINAEMQHVKPFLIPHHKGRKRMHLELKDTMARVGADIKQKLVESIRTTWASVWKTQPPPSDRQLEQVVEEEMEKEQLTDAPREEAREEIVREPTPEMLGQLNSGRRIDYVLQEAPLEVINEYLFAMSSHVCYWESEDTMLLILREIYDTLGVQPDSTIPQPNMTVQRTRTPKENEALLFQEPDHPSTSRRHDAA